MACQNKSLFESKTVCEELPQNHQLSIEQLQYYKENGFVIIKGLIDFNSLDNYKKRFLQIANKIIPRKGIMTIVKEPSLVGKDKNPEDYVNKIQEILYDDVFVQYAQHPLLYDIVTQLIGSDVTAIHSMFINKPPGTGRHPPHQDLYYFPYRPADRIVASWTAVDDVTTDNGCLYVVPGSHKPAVIYEHEHLDDSKILYHGIINEELVAPEPARVHLEMSPGDTVFFHPYLVHGSGPNVSKDYRKSISFHFAATDCICIDVKGTIQQKAAEEIENEANRRGYTNMTFAEIWQLKSRRITGLETRQNLKLEY